MGHMRWNFLVWRYLRSSEKAGSTFYWRRLSSTWSVKYNHFPSCIDVRNGLSCAHVERSLSSAHLSSVWAPILVRRLSVALDVQQSPTELGSQTEVEPGHEKSSSEVTSTEAAATSCEVKPKKEKRERLPAEVAIPLFFERVKVVEQVVGVLKKTAWGEETKKALQGLSLTYDSQLVTQVLRIGFPRDVALGFFHWLKSQDGFKHNEYTYGVMLNSLGKGGHVNEMQDIFAEMKSEGCTVTPVIISCVMHWFARVGDAQNVVRHWEKLKRAGKKPSLGIYTAYLDLLVRVKRFTKIPPVYERMLSEECLPNSRIYTLLIQHLADAGRLRAAVKILEIMQKLYVVPSRVAYEFIIEGYVKSGDVEKVQEFLNEMRERFHRPSKRLIPAVKALQAAGKTEEAAILMGEIQSEDSNEMEHEDGEVSEDNADGASVSEDGVSILDSLMGEWRDVTCPHLGFDVNGFAQALHSWNPSVEVALERANVKWQSSLVLEVLRRLRNLETSWPFFHWVKGRAGFKHDMYSCMVMIQRILKSRSPIDRTASLVDELFEVMQKDGVKFTVPMFNMMIRHYVLACDIERALDMFDRIRQFQLEPNAASYAPVIQALARDRQGKRAMDVLKAMQEAGFQPDSATCAELITCLELADKIPSAYELFCEISEAGRSPSALEYKAMMAAYSRAGDQKMALKLYEQMRGAGIKPTQDMFDEVSVILRKANRQYDINTIAKHRKTLKYFGGRKKALQEDLLQVLDLFMRSMKPRPNNAYASASATAPVDKNATFADSDDATLADFEDVTSADAMSAASADAAAANAATSPATAAKVAAG